MKPLVTTVQLNGFKLWMASIFLTLVSLILSPGLPASAQTSRFVDVVFDLDGTLVNPITSQQASADPAGIFQIEGEFYHLTDHTIEVLSELHRHPEVRVSFFSGGKSERNQRVVDAIYERLHRINPEASPYKVLSLDDLTQVSNDPSLRFSQRYKKDLSRFFDLSSSVLVDDIPQFVMPGQEKNYLGIGIAYKYFSQYGIAERARSMDNGRYPTSPPSEIEWRRERDKLLPVREILNKALTDTAKEHSSFVENLSKARVSVRACFEVFAQAI